MKYGSRKPSQLITLAAALAMASSFGLVAMGIFGSSHAVHADNSSGVPAINPQSNRICQSTFRRL